MYMQTNLHSVSYNIWQCFEWVYFCSWKQLIQKKLAKYSKFTSSNYCILDRDTMHGSTTLFQKQHSTHRNVKVKSHVVAGNVKSFFKDGATNIYTKIIRCIRVYCFCSEYSRINYGWFEKKNSWNESTHLCTLGIF